MLHHPRQIAVLLPLALLAACGSGDDSSAGQTAVATSAAVTAVATSPVAVAPAPDAAPSTAPSPAPTTTPSGEGEASSDPAPMLSDPCSLLALDEIALVLDDPRAGQGTPAEGGVPLAGCEWTEASDLGASLELFAAAEPAGMGGIGGDELLKLRFDADVLAGMEALDVGQGGVVGPEGDDVVAYVVVPDGTIQLRLWAVGAGPRPAERWPELRPAMEQLARAAAERAGS